MRQRLLSLDAFRGLTIAGMLLVNNPGSWSYVYPPLDHAEWNGWTPTDLIFPFFIFIVGIALTLSFTRRLAAGATKAELTRKVLARGAIIWGLGLLLAGFPFYHLATIRIMGVLARIGVVYLATGLIALYATERAQRWIVAGLLVGYWAVMTLVPAPDHGADVLAREGNLAAYVDRIVLGAHRWKGGWDPEGILSTFPAIATCLLGVAWGRRLLADVAPVDKAVEMFVWGNLAMLAGVVWGIWFPVNKNLWTSSYVLFTAGFGLTVLATLYYLIDIRGYTRWAWPFYVFGSNPILVFVLTGLFTRSLTLWKVAEADGSTTSTYTWLFRHVFQPWAGTYNASLAFAVCYVLLFLAAMWVPYRKAWLLKI
ncbi:MAG TPA: DUF5009 domain-containing protein [Gemmatimonadales bacterium]|jgi:predicted acyltransferase